MDDPPETDPDKDPDEREEEVPESEIVRRIAIDIGSNAIKCLIADVDVTSGSIVEALHGVEVPCSFAVSWKASADGRLADDVMNHGLRILNGFARRATALGATQKAAIATEVFRRAANGGVYLSRILAELGLPVDLVEQETEARLGFLTAAAYGRLPRDQLIAWDSGGASFQFTKMADGGGAGSASGCGATGGKPALLTYLGALGVGVATFACVEVVQGRAFAAHPSPNPVSLSDATWLVSHLRAQLPPPPDWLLGSTHVVAIGGPNSMFALATALALGPEAGRLGGTVSPGQVWALVEALAGLSDEELTRRQSDPAAAAHAAVPAASSALLAAGSAAAPSDPPSFVLPKLCLLYAVLDFLQLPSFYFEPAIGSCAGMLAEEDLWHAPAPEATRGGGARRA